MKDSESCCALLVESDSVLAAAIRRELDGDQRDQWRCIISPDLDGGLARLTGETPDVLVLGLGLPGSPGIEGVTQLLSLCPHIPLVVLTGPGDEASGIAAMAAGAQDQLSRDGIGLGALPRTLRHAVVRGRLQQAVRDSEERYRELFDGTLGFLCLHDMEGRILSANLAACGALGYGRGELTGRLLSDFVEQPHGDEIQRYLMRLQAMEFDTGLLVIAGKSGEQRIWEYRNVVQRKPGAAPHVIGHAIDVTERVKQSRERREQSRRDVLTGCYNRRYLDERSRDTSFGPSWGCIFINLIDFPGVQATRGIVAADEMLVRTGHFLNAMVRASDAVVRLRADLFVLLLNGAGEAETAVVTERIQKGAHGMPHPFSIGPASREGREALWDTVERAERNMSPVRLLHHDQQRRARGAVMPDS